MSPLGYQAIIQRYGLNIMDNQWGLCQWQLRMAIHLAFHRSPINIALHTVMPPFNALGILMLLMPFMRIDSITLFGASFSLAWIILLGVMLMYVCIDALAALIVVLPIVILFPLIDDAYVWLDSNILFMTSGVMMFSLALWVQIVIGHHWAEKGIGDEQENIEELFVSKNPIPFVLLPIYTIIDLLMMLGYRPALARKTRAITEDLHSRLIQTTRRTQGA